VSGGLQTTWGGGERRGEERRGEGDFFGFLKKLYFKLHHINQIAINTKH